MNYTTDQTNSFLFTLLYEPYTNRSLFNEIYSFLYNKIIFNKDYLDLFDDNQLLEFKYEKSHFQFHVNEIIEIIPECGNCKDLCIFSISPSIYYYYYYQ